MLTIPDKLIFRPDEVAKLLMLSRSTIYSWIYSGKLKAIKVAGSSWRIERGAIQDILETV